MNAYNSSLQNRSEITFPFQVISKMYVFMLIVSALGLIYLIRKKTTIIFMIGLAIISNAIITGGLVGLEDRYSTRQNYLIILLFLVILSNSVFTFLKKDKKDSIF
jgi:hypothetical protein